MDGGETAARTAAGLDKVTGEGGIPKLFHIIEQTPARTRFTAPRRWSSVVDGKPFRHKTVSVMVRFCPKPDDVWHASSADCVFPNLLVTSSPIRQCKRSGRTT